MLRTLILAGVVTAFTAAPAMAGDFSAVSTIDKAVIVTNEDGSTTTTFVKADRVLPGDKLFYKITYENSADDAVDDVSLVMKVPAEVTFSENSARYSIGAEKQASLAESGVSVAFSTDGGVSFAPRGDLKVSVAGQDRSAVSEDITTVRFIFEEPIPSGAAGSVSFSAIVR